MSFKEIKCPNMPVHNKGMASLYTLHQELPLKQPKVCMTVNLCLLLGLQVLCLEKDLGPLCQTGTKSQLR